jgi:hypothetical protein
MNSPARQALLVLMLVLGGCNGDVTLVLGIEAGTDGPTGDAPTEGQSPGSDAPMATDAADGGTEKPDASGTSDASDASDAPEEANPTDGAPSDGEGQ